MCKVTATEFKENLGKYMMLSLKEEILITKNGKPFTKLVGIKSSSWDELVGVLNEKDLNLDDPKTAGILKQL